MRTSSPDAVRAAALADFLSWIYTDGQQFAIEEGYTELPPQLLASVREKVKTLRSVLDPGSGLL
jgi:hypothetical protein